MKHINRIYVYPNDEIFYISFYDDSTLNGNSISSITEKKDIEFSFTLKEKAKYKFAGFNFILRDMEVFDISTYENVVIKMKSKNYDKLDIVLFLHVDGYTNPSDVLSYRYLMLQTPVSHKYQTYYHKIKKFKTADWWYIDRNLDPSKFPKIDFTKFRAIEINNCDIHPVNLPETVSVKYIAFEKNMIIPFILIFLLAAIYYFLAFFIKFNKFITGKFKSIILKSTKSLVPSIILDNYFDIESKRLIEYISSSYNNPDLSLTLVNHETGIPEHKITKIIKKNFNLTYNQYLNYIRIEAAKKLLKTTDRQVLDIAFSAGYNNVSHFNRIFKQITKTTPKEYRLSNN